MAILPERVPTFRDFYGRFSSLAMTEKLRVGVLALQGAFIEHVKILESLGVDTFLIRKRDDIGGQIDGLVIPGGESTVMGALAVKLGLMDPLRELITAKKTPVFVCCGDLILHSESEFVILDKSQSFRVSARSKH